MVRTIVIVKPRGGKLIIRDGDCCNSFQLNMLFIDLEKRFDQTGFLFSEEAYLIAREHKFGCHQCLIVLNTNEDGYYGGTYIPYCFDREVPADAIFLRLKNPECTSSSNGKHEYIYPRYEDSIDQQSQKHEPYCKFCYNKESEITKQRSPL